MRPIQISENWTPEERLAVVGQIAVEIARAKFPSQGQLMDWAERLSFTASASPKWLEINRTRILGDIHN